MDLSGVTLSAKLSSTTLSTLVNWRKLCLMSSSELAAAAGEMLGPNIPPAIEHRNMMAGGIQKERRFAAKGYNLPVSSIDKVRSPAKGRHRYLVYMTSVVPER